MLYDVVERYRKSVGMSKTSIIELGSLYGIYVRMV